LLIDKPPRPYLTLTGEQVKKAADAVKQVSHGKRTATQTAIRYVLHHPAVTSAIVGIRTSGQLRDAAGTLSTPPLTEDEIAILKASVPAIVYTDHRN
jgi:aryl-alcohol dehydrogenase-like predicted oxidoreductase